MDELENLVGKDISEIDADIVDAFKSINIKVAILEYKYKNCGKRYPSDSFKIASIDFSNPLPFDELIDFNKLFIFWHFNGIITDMELFDIRPDRDSLRNDYDFIIDMIENDEAHNLRYGDTKFLAAKRLDDVILVNNRKANRRDFVFKVSYLQKMLNEIKLY